MSIISTTRALDTKETKREIILIDIHNPITHRNKETIVKAFVKEFQQVLLEVKSRKFAIPQEILSRMGINFQRNADFWI